LSLYPNADFLTSAAQSSQFPADLGQEVAFAGRSNSGKSSAINAMLGRHGLARASKTPGRTRLLNFFVVAPERRIVDLPGYGYATASAAERATWDPMISALVQRRCLRGLFIVVDSRRGLLPGDWELIEWAAELPIHVLLSKADKLKRSEAREVLKTATTELRDRGSAQLFSIEGGEGVRAAQKRLDEWLGIERKGP
jgi:GTP-binding protein